MAQIVQQKIESTMAKKLINENKKNAIKVVSPSAIFVCVICVFLIVTSYSVTRVFIVYSGLICLFLLVAASNHDAEKQAIKVAMRQTGEGHDGKVISQYTDMMFAFTFSALLIIDSLLCSFNSILGLISLILIIFGALITIELQRDIKFADTFLSTHKFIIFIRFSSLLLSIFAFFNIFIGSWSWPFPFIF